MIAVDLLQRRIEASVRALAERDAVPARAGRSAALRAELGREVHRRVRAHAAAQVPAYRGEVAVTLTTTIDDFTAIVRGRIDGLVELERVVIVEEVKSTVQHAAAIERTATDAWSAAVAQVRLYALALACGGEARRIETRLRIVSLVDGSEHLRDVPFAAAETTAWLHAGLRAVVEDARARQDRRVALSAWAETLRFPHARMRPHQGALVDALSDALALQRPVVLNAPTGLGKTACAMTAALRHALGRGARLVWLTAKTTQQELAARTLERIVEGSGAPGVSLSAVTLRAKGTTCGAGTPRCLPLACPFLDDFDARLRSSDALACLRAGGVHVDPEAIVSFAHAHRLCPWELGLRLAEHADVVIGDFNYAFDPVAALAVVRAIPRVVVIDEAHNLPERARGHDSPFLPRIALTEARAAARGDRQDPELEEELAAWLDALLDFVDTLARRAVDEELQGFAGQAPVELDVEALDALHRTGRALALRHMRLRLRSAAQERAPLEPEPELDPIMDAFDRVHRMIAALASSRVVPYVADATAPIGRGMGLVCVDASPRLAAIHAEAAGTIAMSATMGPLDHAARELGLEPLQPIRFAVPSPFPRAHRRIVALADVDTSLSGRTTAYEPIARRIEAVIGVRPGNYVAFFPSFAFLSEVRRRLALPSDALLVQLPGMIGRERARTIAALRARDRPRLLLAVSGGAFAEGIDLPGDALVGVIVVGPPLPAIEFGREVRRAHLDDQGDDGFAVAYGLPAIERVVQAAGRVIRSMTDRGVIVLLGRRFADPRWHDALPDEWRDDPAGPLLVDDLDAELARFWAEADTCEPSPSPVPLGASARPVR